jgi:hypothetical protein
MKLNKKELKNLSLQLDYYQQNKEDYSRELLTLRQTLKMLNILTVVEIEVLKYITNVMIMQLIILLI